MIAVLAAATVQASAVVFAPPLDRAIDYTVSEVRADDAATLRFAADRRVTFRAAPDGFVAEVETRGVTGATGSAGRMFEAMTRAQVGRRIVLRLDRSGAVIDVDDIDALWTAQLAAMSAALATGDQTRIAPAIGLLSPLRALPRERKVAMIGAILGAMVAGDMPPPGTARVITQPARALDGTTATLSGSETVSSPDARHLLYRRSAAGLVGAAEMTVTLKRTIDRASGLARESVQTSVTTVAGRRQTLTRSTVISVPVF